MLHSFTLRQQLQTARQGMVHFHQIMFPPWNSDHGQAEQNESTKLHLEWCEDHLLHSPRMLDCITIHFQMLVEMLESMLCHGTDIQCESDRYLHNSVPALIVS